jgi:hypothetical protein
MSTCIHAYMHTCRMGSSLLHLVALVVPASVLLGKPRCSHQIVRAFIDQPVRGICNVRISLPWIDYI